MPFFEGPFNMNDLGVTEIRRLIRDYGPANSAQAELRPAPPK